MTAPTTIRLSNDKKMLTVAFTDIMADLPAELLRVESPSAEIQGHGPQEKRTSGGKQNVTITKIDPVGNYAIKLIFSDGHQTGFYTWEYLHTLAHNQTDIWQNYLTNLEKTGLSRTQAV